MDPREDFGSMGQVLHDEEQELIETGFRMMGNRLQSVSRYLQHVAVELSQMEKEIAALYAAWRKTQ